MAVEAKLLRRMERRVTPSGMDFIGVPRVRRGACLKVAQPRKFPLREVTAFALRSHGEHAHGVVLDHETVQSDVPGCAEGYDQLAQVSFDPAPEQWMRGQCVYS